MLAGRWTIVAPIAVLAALAPTAYATSPGRGAGDELQIHWKGDELDPQALPPDLPEPARALIGDWSAWAEEAGYRLDLDESARVLVLSRSSDRAASKRVDIAQAVLELFDEALPPPAKRLAAEEVEGTTLPDVVPEAPETGTAPPDDSVPEDPEEEEHPWEAWGNAGAREIEYTTFSYSTGATGPPPDKDTVIFFVAKDDSDYRLLLAQLERLHPYLAPWVPAARKSGGFALQQPLAGCYVENTGGREEWSPENEFANRLAQVLLHRRFGQQPYWVAQGWAWFVEMRLFDSVYCFPYRDEFVSVAEHTDWDVELENRFERRKKRDYLRPDEFVTWRRGEYVDTSAKLAWGVVDYLAQRHTEKVPALLEELRAFYDADNRVVTGENTWARDLAYEIPLEHQERILEKHLGEGFWKAATRHFLTQRKR